MIWERDDLEQIEKKSAALKAAWARAKIPAEIADFVKALLDYERVVECQNVVCHLVWMQGRPEIKDHIQEFREGKHRFKEVNPAWGCLGVNEEVLTTFARMVGLETGEESLRTYVYICVHAESDKSEHNEWWARVLGELREGRHRKHYETWPAMVN